MGLLPVCQGELHDTMADWSRAVAVGYMGTLGAPTVIGFDEPAAPVPAWFVAATVQVRVTPAVRLSTSNPDVGPTIDHE